MLMKNRDLIPFPTFIYQTLNGIYFVSMNLPSILEILTHFNSHNFVRNVSHLSLFTYEETVAQRCQVILPRSHHEKWQSSHLNLISFLPDTFLTTLLCCLSTCNVQEISSNSKPWHFYYALSGHQTECLSKKVTLPVTGKSSTVLLANDEQISLLPKLECTTVVVSY